MKTIHLAAQYFLNHRLRIDEVRQQVRELAEAGPGQVLFTSPRETRTGEYVTGRFG